MNDRLKHFFSAIWPAITGFTIAQINALLGTLSLIVGISYQLWRWHRDAGRKSRPRRKRPAAGALPPAQG